MIRRILLYIVVIFLFLGCLPKSVHVQKVQQILNEPEPKLLFFFYPDCPVCLLNVNEVKEFYSSYNKKGKLYVIFPGLSPDTAECKQFMKENLPGIPFAFDREKKLSDLAKTRVIPEGAILTKDNKLIYHGAIDDRFPAPGVKRIKASKLYLQDALERFLKGESPEKEYVETSGCVVE